jgi:hypothetical protein
MPTRMTKIARYTAAVHRATVAAIVLALPVAAGCTLRPREGGDDSARLRVVELEQENDRLSRRLRELEAQLSADDAALSAVPEEIRIATPHVAEVEIGRLSHMADLDDDGTPDMLRVYVAPRDGLGRFVQAVGELAVSAILPQGDRPAATVGLCTLSPLALRQAYRSGIGGTHYTIECPLDWKGLTPQRVLVAASFTDAVTGRRLQAERAVEWR